MTRKALEKLNDKQIHYCETLSSLIARFSKNGNNEDNMRYRAKLRGYLEALEDMGVITVVEKRCLYLYYTEKNMKKEG